MALVHQRMPVVLAQNAWKEWLRPGPVDRAVLNELLVPPDDLLDAHPVGSAVNSARNDGPQLLVPVSLPNFPMLLTM
jgi:putative SOS response-associated peptidase YedK